VCLQVYTLKGLSIMGVEETQGSGSYHGASWSWSLLKRTMWINITMQGCRMTAAIFLINAIQTGDICDMPNPSLTS